MTFPGPPALGRGVVVRPAADPPEPWASAERIVVGPSEVDDPTDVVDRLHEAWATRTPVVIEAAADPATYREPRSQQVEPWTLSPDHDVLLDRLHFLVWANTYDARDGVPVWWWGRKAARLGAVAAEHGADVALAPGVTAWIDGGPRDSVDPDHLDAVVVHAESVELGRLTPVPSFGGPVAVLAPDQAAAVAHRGGPARIIAPAGSGKTRVLAERLRHLIGDRQWETDALVAVAYNVRAREEMEARTEGLGARILTLNALAYRVVTAGLGRQPPVLEEPEVRATLDGILPKGRPRLNTDPMAPYLEALTGVRLGLRDPAEVEATRDDVAGFAEAFPRYRDALRRRGAVDFDEQVYLAIELLLADGPLRRRLQATHRHLLVDELQDLTPAHLLLIRLLTTPRFDVFGVGDDDQVIYGHAGADPRFLIHYDTFFPGARHLALEVNYRCPTAVVSAATTLLGHNRVRVAKEIRPGPHAPTGDRLSVVSHGPADAGAAVVDTVKGWLGDGAAPSEVAVLVRVNDMRLAPVIALREAAIAVWSRLPPEILGRTGVRAALAWLRVALDPGQLSADDLAEVRRRPSRGFPRWIDKWLSRCSSAHDIRKAGEAIDDERVAEKMVGLADDIEVLADLADEDATTRQLLEAVRDRIGLDAAVARLDRSKGGGGASHIDALEALVSVADLHPDPTGFEGWLADHVRRPGEGGGVTVATVHKVKGQEWPRVAVFGANNRLMPHHLAEGEAGREEERRVFHVALTRGSEHVAVLTDSTAPSPFVTEMVTDASEMPPPAPRNPSTSRSDAIVGGGGVNANGPLFERLKTWRTERARADQIAPFIIAHDATLRDIAAAAPSTPAALLQCHGMGPAKVERYGAEILAVVASQSSG